MYSIYIYIVYRAALQGFRNCVRLVQHGHPGVAPQASAPRPISPFESPKALGGKKNEKTWNIHWISIGYSWNIICYPLLEKYLNNF